MGFAALIYFYFSDEFAQGRQRRYLQNALVETYQKGVAELHYLNHSRRRRLLSLLLFQKGR